MLLERFWYRLIRLVSVPLRKKEMNSAVENLIFEQIKGILEDFAKTNNMFLVPWYHGEPRWVLRAKEDKNKSIAIVLMEKNGTWPGYFYLLVLAEIFKNGWEERYRGTIDVQTEVDKRLNYKLDAATLEGVLKEAFSKL